MRKPKRTLKQYIDLYRNPRTLFPGGPDSQPVEIVLFPNGANEIVARSTDGRRAIRITISDGPHGLGLQLYAMPNTAPITIASPDQWCVELCQYRPEPKAQAFRRWYREEETEADLQLLGPEYRRQHGTR